MSAETWPKESQRMCNGASGQVPVLSSPELPEALLHAAWAAVDVVEHIAAGFVDALNNPPDARADWPLERIAADANPDALAVAFAAWLNACAAVYQHPKATATP